MCGRYNFSKDSSSEMVQAVLENLQRRQIEVKTGEVFPGDVAAVIASNRKLEPQAFGMKWGYQLPDGKLIFNARSETVAQKAMFADGMRQRRWKRMLFAATGALMSTTSSQQGDSIPGISHAVALNLEG